MTNICATKIFYLSGSNLSMVRKYFNSKLVRYLPQYRLYSIYVIINGLCLARRQPNGRVIFCEIKKNRYTIYFRTIFCKGYQLSTLLRYMAPNRQNRLKMVNVNGGYVSTRYRSGFMTSLRHFLIRSVFSSSAMKVPGATAFVP